MQSQGLRLYEHPERVAAGDFDTASLINLAGRDNATLLCRNQPQATESA